MLSAKIEGTDLQTVIASLKHHELAADIIPDHQVEIGADGEVINLASHAGKVEFHQKVCTLIVLRDGSGQVNTTIEIDHQWFDGKKWNYRTAEDIAAKAKSILDEINREAQRNPLTAELVSAVKTRPAKTNPTQK